MAVAGYFERRGLSTRPEQVILAPGSKVLLAAIIAVAGGDVLVPQPCWLTYAAQARLFRQRCHRVPAPAGYGGVPEPDALRRAISRARRNGANPRLLVMTLPDNPTGTLAPPDIVFEVCEVAEREGITIVSDEIYRDLVFDPKRTPVRSAAEMLPARTVVTTGLSKSLGLGGWRIGAARFPDGHLGRELRDGVLAIGSVLWSCMVGPMQEVARYAFTEPPEVTDHVRRCRKVHGALARRVREIMVAAGASCSAPAGGFYVYPDFEDMRAELASSGILDSGTLQQHLLRDYGIAVMGGHHFGEEPERLRLRAATSMLCGETDAQRQQTLSAADPLEVPHVQAVLSTLAEAIGRLTMTTERELADASVT